MISPKYLMDGGTARNVPVRCPPAAREENCLWKGLTKQLWSSN